MTSTATDVVAAALRPQTVRLTVAEDCDADEATCTEDKRKLSKMRRLASLSRDWRSRGGSVSGLGVSDSFI